MCFDGLKCFLTYETTISYSIHIFAWVESTNWKSRNFVHSLLFVQVNVLCHRQQSDHYVQVRASLKPVSFCFMIEVKIAALRLV